MMNALGKSWRRQNKLEKATTNTKQMKMNQEHNIYYIGGIFKINNAK
jgi:hypothetical protein